MIQTLNILERTHLCGKGVAESLGELAFKGCSIALSPEVPNLSGRAKYFMKVR